MNKKINRLIALICAFLVIFLFSTFPISAEDCDSNIMMSAAQNIIDIAVNEANNTITYKNLDKFVDFIKSEYHDISDLSLAMFILTYTGSNANDLPESIILEALDYAELTVSSQTIKVTSNGETTVISEEQAMSEIKQEIAKENSIGAIQPMANDTWLSPNGYMKIWTEYAYTKTTTKGRHFVAATRATWLKMPICKFQDVLAIGNTGVFDDSYKPYAYILQKSSCCGAKFNDKRETVNGKGSGIAIIYPAVNGAAAKFSLKKYRCSSPALSHTNIDTHIEAYLRYGFIITGSTGNIQAGYSHKEVALGSISVGITAGGSLSFSLTGVKKDYLAKPLTI